MAEPAIFSAMTTIEKEGRKILKQKDNEKRNEKRNKNLPGPETDKIVPYSEVSSSIILSALSALSIPPAYSKEEKRKKKKETDLLLEPVKQIANELNDGNDERPKSERAEAVAEGAIQSWDDHKVGQFLGTQWTRF